jgi:hypothetical protein
MHQATTHPLSPHPKSLSFRGKILSLPEPEGGEQLGGADEGGLSALLVGVLPAGSTSGGSEVARHAAC